MNKQSYNISIIGSGYVGMSLAVLLAQHNRVTIFDIDREKVDKINFGISPVKDNLISEYLKSKELRLKADLPNFSKLKNDDIIIIATPTDFDEKTNKFDTRSVDRTIEDIQN